MQIVNTYLTADPAQRQARLEALCRRCLALLRRGTGDGAL